MPLAGDVVSPLSERSRNLDRKRLWLCTKKTFVLFVDFVSININGMILRPILNNKDSFLYGIDFKYPRGKLINVTCEVERPDMKLVVVDPGAVNTRSIGYEVTGN